METETELILGLSIWSGSGEAPPPVTTRNIVGDTEIVKNTVGDTEVVKNQVGDTE